MISPLSTCEAAAESVNGICLRLFDTWCETRAVVPLAYLMHCWPLLDNHESSVRRLAETLQELEKFHPHALSDDEIQLLRQLGTLASDMIRHPAGDPVTRIERVGREQGADHF
ncbi:hypothetical protein WJ41_29690 [Burkholderia ubonensis]|uniref:hypothetical protein n=1 Tax=Burkholderia ubonensis TaxID=101571 RepID=UPI00075442CC|nr:hypothetical protein [Burkholderia ubonensis]KVH80527.1 hypothetical protein WJ41_29690 [Burkholderia ubonensis]KVU05496.1 hypothetical protein WK61_32045 [Burkholderia ubonensis]